MKCFKFNDIFYCIAGVSNIISTSKSIILKIDKKQFRIVNGVEKDEKSKNLMKNCFKGRLRCLKIHTNTYKYTFLLYLSTYKLLLLTLVTNI